MDKCDEKRIRSVAYDLCLGINQLIDRGCLEKCNDIEDKVLNGNMIEYILNKYKDSEIHEFESFTFGDKNKEALLKLDRLLFPYVNVIKNYKINNNGLILASSILANLLYNEF
ncbi:hypothetical protein NNC19_04990 [Clostridium sp. SHJSY1]|uniref:hypothetical protein n=1 Tax=Clostridium sp. SHJSY1 TaxID=2942483 RepID=UPI0028741CC0|nr:hypothetical protein [Clostridium sp. SHJSY1]MDS0525028.1 hypothetical protein [Clostridium sp. SHJSY1]